MNFGRMLEDGTDILFLSAIFAQSTGDNQPAPIDRGRLRRFFPTGDKRLECKTAVK